MGYFAVVVGLALSLSGKQKDTGTYFLANRRMPWLAVSLSVVASVLSAITYLGAPQVAYEENAALVVGLPATLLAAPLVILLFFPIYRRLQVTSIYEYVGLRFGSRSRYTASFFSILQLLGWMGIALYAPALALSTVTGLDLWSAIIVMGLVATAYTTLGGMAAVIWTDVVQFLVLAFGAVLITLSLIERVPGGMDRIMEMASAHDKLPLLDLTFSFSEINGLTVVICYFIIAFGQYGTSQVPVQRLLSIKNFRGMVKAQILDHLLEIILLALLFFIGLGLFAYFSLFPERLAEGISGDRILPFYIIHALPAGISGLIIAAVFAAAMSTVDSGIHSMSTMILVDFIQPLRKRALDSRQGLQVARGLTIGLGLLATASGLLVSQIEGILKAISMVGGYVASPVTALFLMGILTRRGNFGGWLIATCLVTIPTQVYIQNYSDTHWIFYGPLGMVICLAVSYPFSLIYARVRRLPPADREYTLWRRKTPGEASLLQNP